ncbi:ABC transporter C family member 13 [Asparagus officinalis]|uniref:ABC transporter C family member 13 n=1 Tax=Asparagus officinalis TaxID=4686 RepID=UPI00098E5812|nr:ABC transporter C family member 13 [Asparagus officinalis]
MDFICPKNPKIWDGNGFTPCFENMVFGFGANFVTIAAVLGLAISKRNAERSRNIGISSGKVFLHILPSIGACLSFYETFLLLENSLHGYYAEHHEWFFRCSQLISWFLILLVMKFDRWFLILCNLGLCFWWITRPLFAIPHLYTVFSSSKKVLPFCIESCLVLSEIMFGFLIVMIRAIRGFALQRNFNTIEDPLLSDDRGRDEGPALKLGLKIVSYWDLLTFKFVNIMMDHGVMKQLDFEDLIQLPCELMPHCCHTTILRSWAAEKSKRYSQPSLFGTIFHAYGWPYLCLGVLKGVNDAIGFLGPLLLNRLLRFLEQGSGHTDGYILALSLGLTSIFKSFLDTQYSYHLMKLKLKLRSSLMTMVYHKCLHISLSERSKFSEGEVQTFMSIDTDRTVNLCNSFHDMWSMPLQICVALYLLYTQVRFAFVAGLVITILLIPVNKWISTLIARATEGMMKEKDERIRGAGELLSYIRTLKMYGWESIFADRLMERREMEVKYLSTRKYLDAWCVFFWATTPTLFSLFTFSTFALMGHPLNAATVFTCIALFNTLITPLNSFPWVINGLIDAVISTRRLSKFLSCPEHKSAEKHPSHGQSCILDTLSCSSEGQRVTDADPLAIVFQDACCVWSSSNEEDYRTILSRITLNLPRGMLIAIIGEIGSGKSSLLSSILGEMRTVNGLISSRGSIAYVPQVPWILSGSIRDNILFGEKPNARRYEEVLQACALDVDISRMIGDDLAYIGEKGLNLSGGQRARLALARAIYRDSDVYLLDDILSAVDSQVAVLILQKAILGPLMNQKTRVLCTHNVQAISAADMIIVMNKGSVKWAGPFSSFLLSPYSMMSTSEASKDASSQLTLMENSLFVLERMSYDNHLSDCISLSKEAQNRTDVEAREEGRVNFRVYKSYAAYTGWPVVSIICISAVLMQASRNGNDIWLSHWVDATTGTEYMMYYMFILIILGAANSLLTLVRAFSFAYGGLHAAVRVHSDLLKKLVNAPIIFFDQNSSGRILNRLSSDLYMIDDSLPFILNILLNNFLVLLGITTVLCYTQITFVLLLFPLGFIYKKLQFYYRCTSRELRRLDSVSRSPIYSSFTETLDGSATIRAFETEDLFMGRFTEHVALYQRTSYAELTASLWLSLRLQLLAASVVSFIALMAVIGCRSDLPFSLGTPGLIGLGLSYAAPVVSSLSNFLTSFTETEKEMVSIERVLQYMDIPQEGFQGSQTAHPNWPFQGHIEFVHVTLKYKPSLPAALNDVSFNISAGMQIGIVGRTGAGKSSVMNALFRLTPICNGRILVDGVDVADIAVTDLRGRMAVVPQSPFLSEGSLRDNLDPLGKTSDIKIWETLEKCHIKEEVELAGGLDIHVKDSGISFSVGQQQLICLARALIKSSKILCLDECTANIDTQTASVLQNTISNECKGMTVLTIAHRISVVLDMDNILVLDHGVLVEQGNPHVLLKNNHSRFAGLARASTM